MFTLVISILVTALVTAGITALTLYLKSIRPLVEHSNELFDSVNTLAVKLGRQDRLCSDIIAWVEIECREQPKILKAVKQRINERLAQDG